jgi:hypothetical protein
MLSSRGRSGGRAAGKWSCGSGDVSFRSAGPSRRNGAIASGRDRSLFRSISAGLFSFLFVLARVGALSVLGVDCCLLRLADVPDKSISVGIVHITVGQFPPTTDVIRIRGPDGSLAHSAQSLQVCFFVPGEEVAESFISSHPGARILPFPEADLDKLQIIAEVDRVSGSPLPRPGGRICLLGAKEEFFCVEGHGILPGLQSQQLFQHVPVGRVNRNTPGFLIQLQSPLNVFDGSGKHV